jgi:hypothetical protein
MLGIQGDRDEALYASSVKSLLWLILTDSGHTVTAEGVALHDLDRQLDKE